MSNWLLRIDVDLLRLCADIVIVAMFIFLWHSADAAILQVFSFLLIVACLVLMATPFVRRFLYRRNFHLLPDEYFLFRVEASLIEGPSQSLKSLPGVLLITNHRLIFDSGTQQRVMSYTAVLTVQHSSRLLGIERWISIVMPDEELTFFVNFPNTLAAELNRAIGGSKDAATIS